MLIIKSCEEFSQTEITPSLKVDGVAQGNKIDIDKLKTYNSLMFKTSRGIDPQNKMINNESFVDTNDDLCEALKDGLKTGQEIIGGQLKKVLKCKDQCSSVVGGGPLGGAVVSAADCLTCFVGAHQGTCGDCGAEGTNGDRDAECSDQCFRDLPDQIIRCTDKCVNTANPFSWGKDDSPTAECGQCVEKIVGGFWDPSCGVLFQAMGWCDWIDDSKWQWNGWAQGGNRIIQTIDMGREKLFDTVEFIIKGVFNGDNPIKFFQDIPKCIHDISSEEVFKKIIGILKDKGGWNNAFNTIKDITGGWGDFSVGMPNADPDGKFASMKMGINTSLLDDTFRDVITGGNGTLNVGNAKTDTGIKNVVDAIINWIIDTFIRPFIMLFKALFGWIINPISAAFGSVYGLFISICYVFIIVILVGIILDIFSIAKIWAG